MIAGSSDNKIAILSMQGVFGGYKLDRIHNFDYMPTAIDVCKGSLLLGFENGNIYEIRSFLKASKIMRLPRGEDFQPIRSKSPFAKRNNSTQKGMKTFYTINGSEQSKLQSRSPSPRPSPPAAPNNGVKGKQQKPMKTKEELN